MDLMVRVISKECCEDELNEMILVRCQCQTHGNHLLHDGVYYDYYYKEHSVSGSHGLKFLNPNSLYIYRI